MNHAKYLQFQRAIRDDCTCYLTEQNIEINNHYDAVILSIGHYRYKIKHIFTIALKCC